MCCKYIIAYIKKKTLTISEKKNFQIFSTPNVGL